MGSYFRVLIALGLDPDILALAKEYVLKRKLQDAKLLPNRELNHKDYEDGIICIY